MTRRTLEPTPGQTVGPFFAIGLDYTGMSHVVEPGSPGAVRLHGRVLDGEGTPVPDAVVEVWGCDGDGEVPRATGVLGEPSGEFTGFGRCGTTTDGTFEFWTIAPGAPDGRAPFFAAVIFARGLLDRLHTRIYLPDHPELLESDALLSALEPARRDTLVASRVDATTLHHDIWLQGEKETVFLAF